MNKCLIFCFLYLVSILSTWAALEGEVSSYSNFIWRGTTFSENKPALQVTLDAQEDHGFFIGSFISNAEFSDEAMSKDNQVNQEIDYTFGKRWQSKEWELQLSYNRFTFPGAEVFDTDEFNLFLNYKRFILELSYMDDYFGYQSAYRYIRIGHEWTYTSTFGATFFAGYNAFATPKGGIKSRCLDSSCSEVAQTTNGAGNPDYIDLFLTHRKILKNNFVLELAINWTNRHEYSVDNNVIVKQHAKDFATIVGIVIPFNL